MSSLLTIASCVCHADVTGGCGRPVIGSQNLCRSTFSVMQSTSVLHLNTWLEAHEQAMLIWNKTAHHIYCGLTAKRDDVSDSASTDRMWAFLKPPSCMTSEA